MYVLEFDANGVLYKITPNAPLGMVGAYIDKLPCTIEELLLTYNEILEDNKIKYIKKENE